VSSINASAGILAAKVVGDDSEMDVIAEDLAALARTEAAAVAGHEFASSIEVQRVRGPRGVTDRLVVATDPLAVPKELGHVVRNEADGPVLGYVKGLHPMGKALAKMREVRGD
jgi:hypothetical protein